MWLIKYKLTDLIEIKWYWTIKNRMKIRLFYRRWELSKMKKIGKIIVSIVMIKMMKRDKRGNRMEIIILLDNKSKIKSNNNSKAKIM